MLQSELAVHCDEQVLGTTIAEVACNGIYDEYIQTKDTPRPDNIINKCAKDALRLWNEAFIKRRYTEVECLPHILTKYADFKYFFASYQELELDSIPREVKLCSQVSLCLPAIESAALLDTPLFEKGGLCDGC